MPGLRHEPQDRLGVALLLFALLAVGFWLRVRHLGDLGLIVDEGIQAVAVQGILEHGVPKVDSGLIYSRAVPFLYAQAASVKLFGLNEFSIRLPAVLGGVAAILGAYFLGKFVFGRSIGLLTAAVMTFSVWEIELSRYGRFYTAFQCMYIFALCYFYRGFMLGEQLYKFLFMVAALISCSLHPLGLALFTCFVIPLPSSSFSQKEKLSLGVWAVALAGLWLAYGKSVQIFDSMADPGSYPAGQEERLLIGAFRKIAKVIGEPLEIPFFFVPRPRLLIELLREEPLWISALAVVSGVATAYLLYRFFRKSDSWRALLAMPMIWMAFLHHFGLVLILLGVYTVFFVRDFRSLLEQPLKIVYAMVSLGLVFWVSFLAAKLTAKQVILATFGYPLYRLYEYFFSWFVQGWPVFLVFVAFGSALLLARFISDRSARAPLFLLGGIYIPAVVTSFALPHYVEARYTFHLYPLMVLVFSAVTIETGFRLLTSLPHRGEWARKTQVGIISLAALFISQDANPVHAWSVGNRNYQSTRDPIRSVINWDLYAGFHQDHKTPSLYIKKHLSPGDRVLALGPPHTVAIYHFYLGQVHYALAGPKDFNYHSVTKDRKMIAFITGSEILESLEQLREGMEGNSQGAIWLIGDRLLLLADNPSYPNHIQEYLRAFADNPDYLGLDGQTFAVRIP